MGRNVCTDRASAQTLSASSCADHVKFPCIINFIVERPDNFAFADDLIGEVVLPVHNLLKIGSTGEFVLQNKNDTSGLSFDTCDCCANRRCTLSCMLLCCMLLCLLLCSETGPEKARP